MQLHVNRHRDPCKDTTIHKQVHPNYHLSAMQGGSVFIGSSTHALQLIANAEFLCIHWTLFSEHMLLVLDYPFSLLLFFSVHVDMYVCCMVTTSYTCYTRRVWWVLSPIKTNTGVGGEELLYTACIIKDT